MSTPMPSQWRNVKDAAEVILYNLLAHQNQSRASAQFIRATAIKEIDRETGLPELLDKSKALRAAQRAYMADRGNVVLGEAVGAAARELDAAIARAEAAT